MGHEHKFRFRFDSAEQVETLLRMQPDFDAEVEVQGRRVFEFRGPQNQGAMPCASASLEEDGLYLCDYESGSVIVKALEHALSLRFTELRVHAL